ncbi:MULTISPECIES: ATP-dependent helicase [Exiguobacterium]|uniref:DNA 3'-5' helicase n=1 Tax=Exiguobacterium undae TaxID=169177 RepID=A0ABX2V8V7_9BACL|nr:MULTISPECIES: ATP-dependent helicase [Exiguobacterium]OAN14069.1 hypothetical protein A3783_16085 [Exiguobacterium undae]
MRLTDTQEKIIAHKDSPLLVTAGPGSGKTRVLVEKTINLIKSGEKKVLALTFSNKAAAEITERLKNRLDQDEMNDINVGTFHSFCLELVLDRGNMIGLPSSLTVIESDKDKIELLKRILNEVGYQSAKKINPKDILKEISLYKQKFKFPSEENEIYYIFEAYNNLLLEQRLIDYDDILFYAYRLLNEKPQVVRLYNRIYKTVFIDEAQDLNEAQYDIIYSLCINLRNIIMIGDENQSIYGFNGSSSLFMTERFLKDFNPEKINMKENFRSTQQIIKASKAIKNYEDNIGMYPLEGEVSITKKTNEYLEAEWVLEKILEQVDKGNPWVENKVKFENIAIIGRNRYVFQELEQLLIHNKIPYNFRTTAKALESVTQEMQIFEGGLKFITNPHNLLNKRSLEIFLSFSNTVKTTDKNYLLTASLKKDKGVNEEIFAGIVKAWEILLKDNELFSRALSEIEGSVKKSFGSVQSAENTNQNYELFLKDITMWKNHWKKYCTLAVTGSRNLIHFKNQIALGKTANYDYKGITLTTVHMAKGLEYDIVFIIGMCEGVFPDYRAIDDSQIEEEKNNMFVALTRAKRVCYLSFPEYRIMPWGKEKKQIPSQYLKDIYMALKGKDT